MKLALLSLPALALGTPLALQHRQASAQITSISASGDGCPPGSYSTLIGVSGTVAESAFDSFGLEAGHDVPVLDGALACDVSITVSFPGSCKRAVLATRTQAYVLLALDAGATAKVSTPFALSGGSGVTSPPDLSYASQAGANLDVDIDRQWDVTITATGPSVTFVAHLGIFLNAPIAELISKTRLDGYGVVLSQEGLC